MDKPLICAAIVLLWIISLLIYLNLNRYQVQYDRARGIAVVVDKWNEKVQTVNLNQQDAVSERPKKALSSQNDINDRLKPRERKTPPEVIEGIQNKEP